MDYLKLITDKENEFEPMFTRMKRDADIFNLAPYTMMGFGKKGGKPKRIDKAYHVTMPDAKQFLEDASSKLAAVNRQVIIEGNGISPDKTTIIEKWLNAIEFESDARLSRKGQAPAYIQHARRVCSRGPIASQVLLRFDDGQFIADVRSLDTLWLTYELTGDGLPWVSNSSRRSAADIMRQYPSAKVSGKAEIVRDYWDNNINVVFVGKEKVDEKPNSYGKPPFNIAFPGIADAETQEDSAYYERLGDSILHNLRTADGAYLFDENNYVASYLKTMSADDLWPAAVFPAPPEGDFQDTPPEVPGSGDMIKSKQAPVLYPRGQLSNAMSMYIQMVQGAMQRGTFATLAHGIIDLPQSGIAIAQKIALQNESLLPRLNAIASLCQQTANMEIEQFVALGETVKLGETGHSETYSPAELVGEYTVKYRFFAQSIEQLASGSAICQQLEKWAPRSFLMGEIMRFQDPSGMEAEIQMEQAAKANPVIDLRNKMIAYIRARDNADDKEIKLINNAAALDLHEQIMNIYRQQNASAGEKVAVDLANSARVEEKGVSGMPVFGGAGQVVSK